MGMVLRSSWVLPKGSSRKPCGGSPPSPASEELGATAPRRSVKERGMLLRLPKPLNLKNSGEERGERGNEGWARALRYGAARCQPCCTTGPNAALSLCGLGHTRCCQGLSRLCSCPC